MVAAVRTSLSCEGLYSIGYISCGMVGKVMMGDTHSGNPDCFLLDTPTANIPSVLGGLRPIYTPLGDSNVWLYVS